MLIKYGEITIRYNNAKNEVINKHKIQDDYQKVINTLVKNNDECNIEDLSYKKSLFEREKEIENLNRVKVNSKNKFSEKLNKTGIFF